MHLKSVLFGGLAGGVVLAVITNALSFVILNIAPYDIFSLGGMRSADDPLLFFFFLFPFIFAFAASTVFDIVKDSLSGSTTHRGLVYGILLFIIFTIPNQFVIYTSMTYPAGFYLSNILTGILGFPILGIVLSVIAERWS